MSYRYRKPSPHLDYSWIEEPTDAMGGISTKILQAHAEAFASKTIAWFRVEEQGYLVLCAQDKDMVDTAGRSCVFMIVAPVQNPPCSKELAVLMPDARSQEKHCRKELHLQSAACQREEPPSLRLRGGCRSSNPLLVATSVNNSSSRRNSYFLVEFPRNSYMKKGKIKSIKIEDSQG